MNDDFLYKRQESPEPAFVAELQEKLAHMVDMPEKSKRKNGQQRFNWKWKAIAAIFVLAIASLLILSQERLRDTIINVFVDDPDYDLLADAYNRYGFELPSVPNRYELSSVQDSTRGLGDLFIRWMGSNHICVLRLSVTFSQEKSIQPSYQVSTENIFGDSYIQIEDTVIMLTDRSVVSENMAPSNTVGGFWSVNYPESSITYSLSTGRGCLSRDEIIAVAQSTIPTSP